ncbi:MAG: hypothetical protein IPN73_18000 [Saprospiraceae bacterium]|nr:hypothetical protein [Saprospiraceae bacterium]MBK7788182.1 hypothetical protein [Saprospiraceae bacterium]MBK8852030.1 hypothetical protein [Saprospiraceae bacterium]MBK9686691.1 hypothetical protein [Saprospiraceae bacterium]
MFKHLLSTSAGNINWMAMFALVTFFIIFSVVLFQVFFTKKDHVNYMAQLPLGDDHDQTSKQ